MDFDKKNKAFEMPVAKVVLFDNEDVITLSTEDNRILGGDDFLNIDVPMGTDVSMEGNIEG